MIYLGRKDDLVWSAQGTSLRPPDSINDNFAPPWCCYVNGYFTTLQLFQGFSSGLFDGLQVTSYDDFGGICTYVSRGFFNTDRRLKVIPQNTTFTTVFQSSNKFRVNSLVGNFEFVIPNIYTQGMIYEIPVATPAIPAGPCGTGTYQSTYYLNKYGITVYEYINSHPLASDFWASFYDANRFLIGGGYYGNYANGSPDPVYQVGLNLPPGGRYNGPYYKGDGQIITSNGDYSYQFQTVGATQLLLQGSPNLLVCGQANPAAQIVSGNSWYTFLQAINAPAFAGLGFEAISGCCDSNAAYGLGTSYNVNIAGNVCGVVRIYSQDWLQDITCNLFPGNVWNATRALGVSYAKGKLYTLYDLSGASGGFRQMQMYSSSYSPPALSYHINSRSENSLVNYHRAISPIGAFQA